MGRCLVFRVPISAEPIRQLLEIDAVAIELGPVDAGEPHHLRPTVTRHPPHMPVPSTMIGFNDTIVRIPNGSVTAATARIIGTGPAA